MPAFCNSLALLVVSLTVWLTGALCAPPERQDYAGRPKTAEERQRFEKKLLDEIRSEILLRLRLPYNRTIPKISVKEGEEMKDKTQELMKLIDGKAGKQTKGKQSPGKGGQHAGANRAVVKTILFGERVSNVTDDGMVQFKLIQNSSKDLLVTGATVTILVRPRRTGNEGHKPEAERLNIKIYALSDNETNSRDGGGDPITELTIFAKRTKLQRLLLPTSFVQDVLESQEKVLRLKIVCDRCVKAGEDVSNTPSGVKDENKKKKGRAQTRSVPTDAAKKLGERHHSTNSLSSDMPYLTINSKRKKSLGSKSPRRLRISGS